MVIRNITFEAMMMMMMKFQEMMMLMNLEDDYGEDYDA